MIDGYQNNVVYLRDVSQLGMLWPDAELIYDNGLLYGSEYYYSTPYASSSRYDMSYNALTRVYGLPVSVAGNRGMSMSATWFLPGGGFVTLQYAPMTYSGGMRYTTVLQVGRY